MNNQIFCRSLASKPADNSTIGDAVFIASSSAISIVSSLSEAFHDTGATVKRFDATKFMWRLEYHGVLSPDAIWEIVQATFKAPIPEIAPPLVPAPPTVATVEFTATHVPQLTLQLRFTEGAEWIDMGKATIPSVILDPADPKEIARLIGVAVAEVFTAIGLVYSTPRADGFTISCLGVPSQELVTDIFARVAISPEVNSLLKDLNLI